MLNAYTGNDPQVKARLSIEEAKAEEAEKSNSAIWVAGLIGIRNNINYVLNPKNKINYIFNTDLSVSEAEQDTTAVITTAMMVYGGAKGLNALKNRLNAARRAAAKGAVKAGDIAVRQAYVNEVRGLGNLEKTLQAEGKSVEEIARTLHQARRDLGVQYKNITSQEALEQIYQRNIDKYGDKLGPTFDWLRGRGKSLEEIINSAKTPGKEFNDLTGVK